MLRHVGRILMPAVLVLALASAAGAQTTPGPANPPSDAGWKFNVYPVFAWIPLGISIDVSVPPVDGGGGGGAGGSGQTLTGRFDGVFLGRFGVTHGPWRADIDGLWAAVGGDRPERPKLTVDVDIYYGYASGGRKIYKELALTGGVRRIAFKYDIKINDDPNFSRKLGLWDPLIGVGWHHLGKSVDLHATFDGGGFGAGADVDLSACFRMDKRFATHFGMTFGYNVIYLRFKEIESPGNLTFAVKQTMHGPIFGVGFYF
jgi:hypothetical protein